jgi:hypothetical protein
MMADVKRKLDRIKERISDANFLANKGLSNEVGIHVFCYSPADELLVRDYIERLVNAPSDNFRIIECNLYKIFLEILSDKKILDKIAGFEEKKGADFLLKELQKTATREAFLAKMKYESQKTGDVLFLTGVGAVYPFMRSHIMLEVMQEPFAKIPIVVFYPGSFNGQDLNLFDEFFDGHYYRAFNLL